MTLASLFKKQISSDDADVVCWDEIDTDEEVLGGIQVSFFIVDLIDVATAIELKLMLILML